jgi:hypothetical protein
MSKKWPQNRRLLRTCAHVRCHRFPAPCLTVAGPSSIILGMAQSLAQHALEQREKRRFMRSSVWLRCWVRDESVRRYACIEELSAGGARIVTAMPPQKGVTVEIQFPVPNGQSVWVAAQVIWRTAGFQGRGGVMGVRFGVDAPTEEMLRSLQALPKDS